MKVSEFNKINQKQIEKETSLLIKLEGNPNII